MITDTEPKKLSAVEAEYVESSLICPPTDTEELKVVMSLILWGTNIFTSESNAKLNAILKMITR